MRFWIKLTVLLVLFVFLLIWLPGTVSDYRAMENAKARYDAAAEKYKRECVNGKASPETSRELIDAAHAFGAASRKYTRSFFWQTGDDDYHGGPVPGQSPNVPGNKAPSR